MFNRFRPKSKYARNIITLMTGTSLAQAIPIAISPILTRMYSPEEFGLFAFFIALTAIVAVVATGRYELAILLPRNNRDAFHVMLLSIMMSFSISALLFFLVIMLNDQITILLKAPEISQWLYWVPISTMLVGTYQSLTYWSNRKAQYKRLAASRIVQAGSSSLTQLGGGVVFVGSTAGLIGGQVAGQTLSTVLLLRLVYQDDHAIFRSASIRRSIVLAKRYINFPKFLILAHGFNTISSQLPAVVLNVLFSTASAGFYTLTQRVLAAPMTLIANALADVFRQEASHSYRQYGSCLPIYKKTFSRLVKISIIPALIFFVTAPELFGFVFGEKWKVSGEYAQILTPMLFFRFITSPLSSMYMIAEKQKIDLAWQAVLLFLTLLSLLVGYFYSDEKLAIALFSASYSMMYAINGIISFNLAKGGVMLRDDS